MQRVATHLISNRIYEVDTHTRTLHVAISVALAAAPAQKETASCTEQIACDEREFSTLRRERCDLRNSC